MGIPVAVKVVGAIFIMCFLGAFAARADAHAIASAEMHSCAVTATGRVKCWGTNRYGELGDGTRRSRATPVTVLGVSDAVSVVAGAWHSCSLTRSGRVRCWGLNTAGQLGDGTTEIRSAAVEVLGVQAAVSLAAGASSNCAVLASGEVKCWGSNSVGQLGNGTQIRQAIPVSVLGVQSATAVYSRQSHTCAVLRNGHAKCWGENRQGQLGNNGDGIASIPVDVVDLTSVATMATGDSSTCAILTSGQTKCWGNEVRVPRVIEALAGAVSISLNATMSNDCAVFGNGKVKCWLNLGDIAETEEMKGHFVFSEVAAAGYHACAIDMNGAIQCWGDGSFYQLGDSAPGSAIPANVVNAGDVLSVSAGASHSCALKRSGNVNCWGSNSSGQLGQGNFVNTPFAVEVVDISDATQISAGSEHSCALLRNGNVKCWGGEINGEQYSRSPTPFQVSNLSGAIHLSSGAGYSCAVVTGGKVKCWGVSAYVLPRGSALAIEIAGITGAVKVDAGYSHACVMRLDGSLGCWGWNITGQLGDGTTFNNVSPSDVVGIDNARSVSAGTYHSCATLSDGRAKCWGGGDYLGNRDGDEFPGSDSLFPVDVIGIMDATRISAGSSFSCAGSEGRTLKCWGSNHLGQLGVDPDEKEWSGIPIGMPSVSGLIDFSVGDNHACAVFSTGKVKCWGSKGEGQLGNGTSNYATTPRQVFGTPFMGGFSVAIAATEGYLEDGSTAAFEVQVDNDTANAASQKTLRVDLSSALTSPVWSCRASTGAACPTISTGVAGLHEFQFSISPGAHFTLRAVSNVDVSRGAQVEIFAKLLNPSTSETSATESAMIIPIIRDGQWRGNVRRQIR